MKTNAKRLIDRIAIIETLVALENSLNSVGNVIIERSQGIINGTCPVDEVDDLEFDLHIFEIRYHSITCSIQHVLLDALSICKTNKEKEVYKDFFHYLKRK